MVCQNLVKFEMRMNKVGLIGVLEISAFQKSQTRNSIIYLYDSFIQIDIVSSI